MEETLIQPQVREEEEPQNKKTLHLSSDVWCEILTYIIWAFTFWSSLEQTNPSECRNPVWFWAQYEKYFFGIGGLVIFFSYVFFAPNLSRSGTWINIFKVLVLLSVTIIRLGLLALFAGGIISYLKRDECPALDIILQVQFYLIALYLAYQTMRIFCLCFCTNLLDLRREGKSRREAAGLMLREFFPICELLRQKNARERNDW